MSIPAVDVVLPAFNAKDTIAAAIRSLQSQTVHSVRIVVVDDGSSDGTDEVVAEMSRADTRVVLLRKPNGGIVSALNAGLTICEAPFVARLDADDLSEADRFERQLRYLERHPNIVAVSGAHREIRQDGTPTGRINRPASIDHLDPDWAPAMEPHLTHPFLMVRRKSLSAVGGYRHAFLSEDTDLYWRLLDQGGLANLEDVLGSYRMHCESLSSASVLNGRIMAVSSQLAALSAQRRARGLSDISFSAERLAQYREAGSLEAIVSIAGRELDSREREWLAVSAAGKLMELAGYRPYELEREDCRFIGRRLSGRLPVAAANGRELRKMLTATSARMLRLGRAEDAARLASPALWPQVLARAGSGRLYWRKHLA